MKAWKPPKAESLKSIWPEYVKMVKEIGAKLPELEALRPFLGKKGQVLKRPTRSRKQQSAFEKALKEFREKHGRGNKKKIRKQVQEQKAKDKKRLDKARRTFRENAKKKAAQEQGASVNFRSTAQKASRQYSRMLEAFMDQELAQLMAEYDIGSPIIQWMAEKGLSVAEMKKLIILAGEAYNDLPDEAKAIASQDEYWQAALNIMNADIIDDFATVFSAALDAQGDGSRDAFNDLLNEYDSIKEDSDLQFSVIWERLADYEDPYNIDNFYEVIEDLESEE